MQGGSWGSSFSISFTNPHGGTKAGPQHILFNIIHQSPRRHQAFLLTSWSVVHIQDVQKHLLFNIIIQCGLHQNTPAWQNTYLNQANTIYTSTLFNHLHSFLTKYSIILVESPTTGSHVESILFDNVGYGCTGTTYNNTCRSVLITIKSPRDLVTHSDFSHEHFR